MYYHSPARLAKLPFRNLILAAIVLLAGRGYCQEAPDKINLSRGYAVLMAITKNIDLRVEALSSSMAETDIVRSRALYDPIFTTSASGGVSATPGDPFFRSKNGLASIGLTQYLPTGGSVVASTQAGVTTSEVTNVAGTTTEWQSSVGVTLSHPLLKNAGRETTELNITLAVNTFKDSVERLRSVINDTLLSVVTSYNHLYTLRQVLEARTAAIDSAQGLLDEINKRKKPGPLQKMEVANVEYSIAQRRKDLVEAERSVRDQEASLHYLIGLEGKTRIIPTDPPSRDEPQATEEQAIKAALESRADLKQLRLALASSQLQERIARHQTLPDLALTASGGLNGTGGNFGKSFQQIGDNPGTFWSAGLQFSLPIGNTAAETDYRKSRIRTEQVQNQIRALEWKVRNDVESDMRALISARLQRQTADRALQYAEQRREEYRKQSRAAAATVQDVINAENDFTAARSSQLDAQETFANAVAKLWRDTGELLDRQGVHLGNPQVAVDDLRK